jgi:hypothetical protein
MSRTIIGINNDVTREREAQNTVTASTTYTAADANKEYNVATDAIVQTLPLITAETLGMEFVFRNTGADAANDITLAPNALDGFNGTVANAAADSVASGAVDKDLVLTKATSNKGDYIKVKAVALTEWYITGGVGIWASEA